MFSSIRASLYKFILLTLLTALWVGFTNVGTAQGARELVPESIVPRETVIYVCSKVRSDDFEEVITRLEKKSLDIVEVYFDVSCGSDVHDSTLLETAISMSNKDFVRSFINYLIDRDEWDRTTYVDEILNHVDANGESLLDYARRLKENARDDSPREAVQWYIDYFKEKGAKHAVEIIERRGNYISPVAFPSSRSE